jgi:hypothetical protein
VSENPGLKLPRIMNAFLDCRQERRLGKYWIDTGSDGPGDIRRCADTIGDCVARIQLDD